MQDQSRPLTYVYSPGEQAHTITAALHPVMTTIVHDFHSNATALACSSIRLSAMTNPSTPNHTTIETTHLADGSSEMPTTPTVYVCQHRSCHDRGSEQTLAAFMTHLPDGTIAVASRCMGQCSSGPTVRIAADEIWYCRVQTEDVATIVDQHILGGEPVTAKLNPRLHRTFYG